jgi:hypothetical protein
MASTQDFFLSLKRAPYRRWVEIGEGTHMVLLEKNRLQAFDAISQFLAEHYAHLPYGTLPDCRSSNPCSDASPPISTLGHATALS